LLAIARDLTQRRQAEVALRENELLLRSIMECTKDIIFVKDRECRFIYMNPTGYKLFGKTPEKLIGRSKADFHPDKVEAQKFMVDDRRVMESSLVETIEEFVHAADGSQHVFMTTKVARRNDQGAVIGLVGVAHDITEHKKIEQLLGFVAQEGWSGPQEDFFIRLVEYIGKILAVDYVFIGQRKDDQTVQTAGLYARGKIVPDMEYSTRGAPCHNVIGKVLCHYGEKLQEMFPEDALLATMDAKSYLGIPLTDSAGRPLGLMAVLDTKPMPDAQLATAILQIAAVRVSGEIERRAKVEELHWKTALMEAHMEAAPDGILMIDNQGRRISQNRRMNELLKIPPHIYQNDDDAEQIKFVASQAKNPQQLVDKIGYLLAHPEEFSRDELEFLDGTVIDRYSSPVRDKAGRSCGRIWTFRDLTQARQLEAQLRQSQKMEAIGQLAGGVAHDFNNILAALLMQTQLLEMIEPLPQEAVDGLEQIRAFTNRAADLTRQLLLFSRRQVMQPCNLDLNEIVTNLAKMLQRIIGEDVRLQLNLHPASLMTRADAGMIEQVLMNLAVNARDAMPEGGQLRIDTTETSVTENVANSEVAPGHYVCFSVSDTGPGIPPEILPKIFEPFFTTKEAGKGTGLGLATAFGIVKQHQGWIKVDNRPGQGATFQVYLPASTLTVAETPEIISKPKPRGGNETIFLVEDESDVRHLIRTLLKRHGYQVLEAANGVEALSVWQAHRETVALLMTDLVMPAGLGGQELARQLQAEQPNLKVIFISGYSAEIAGRELHLHHGEVFIQKPFVADHLLETIRRSLDG
jgi:PAS domain S-box-containing protein